MLNFEGDNVIVICVYDYYGRGGIIGGNFGIYFFFNCEKLF